MNFTAIITDIAMNIEQCNDYFPQPTQYPFHRERIKRCKECLIVLPNKSQLALGKDQNFTFDHVFEESISQDNLYCETVKPLVLSCLDGYNSTVFAYGQTGMR